MDVAGLTADGRGNLEALVPDRWLHDDTKSDEAERNDAVSPQLSVPEANPQDQAGEMHIEVCAVVAGILAIWDINPLHSPDFEISKATVASPVSKPKSACSALISQRDLSD